VSGRSLINIENKIGPRTVPCGTPEITGTLLEQVFSTTTF